MVGPARPAAVGLSQHGAPPSGPHRPLLPSLPTPARKRTRSRPPPHPPAHPPSRPPIGRRPVCGPSPAGGGSSRRAAVQSTADPPDPWPDRPGGGAVRLPVSPPRGSSASSLSSRGSPAVGSLPARRRPRGPRPQLLRLRARSRCSGRKVGPARA
jgi:hypothetical protein